MGLTIHYTFRASGPAADIDQRVRTLRRLFDRLDVDVGQVHHCTDFMDETGYGLKVRDEADYWRQALTTALTGIRQPARGEPTREAVLEAWEGIALPVYIMPGCEPFEVILGRNQDTTEWYGRGFTKTQYADRFAKAHLLVCKLLDLCADIGILDSVTDEGEYYESRDFRQLKCSHIRYAQLIDEIGDALQSVARDNVAVAASWDHTTADLDIDENGEATDHTSGWHESGGEAA